MEKRKKKRRCSCPRPSAKDRGGSSFARVNNNTKQTRNKNLLPSGGVVFWIHPPQLIC